MTYNLTGIAQGTHGYAGFIGGINSELMGGFFGIGLLIALSVIIFMAFYQGTGDVKSSIAATSWLIFVLAIFMRALDWIPNLALFITLVVCAGSIAVCWKS